MSTLNETTEHSGPSNVFADEDVSGNNNIRIISDVISNAVASSSHICHESGSSSSSHTSKESDILASDASSVISEASSDHNYLNEVLPDMEASIRCLLLKTKDDDMNEIVERELDEDAPIDLDMQRDNTIRVKPVQAEQIESARSGPREQEESDEPVREAMQMLFDNQFMKAKAMFQSKADIEPLHALGLGILAFIKAVMTQDSKDIDTAMRALSAAHTVAKLQIDVIPVKKPFKDSFSLYFSHLVNNQTGLPVDPPTSSLAARARQTGEPITFLPNGVLRSHVIKAECNLMMALLHLSRDDLVGYIKCGLNIKRAYSSYTIVWQEYKRMGQDYTKYMDRDTVSGVQLGIGMIQLIMASMPPKIHKIFSTLGWKCDKQLGLALLRLCQDDRSIRSPLASLTLLVYYIIHSTYASQLYKDTFVEAAVECLVATRKNYPQSCILFFLAGRMARTARNIELSTQSFMFAAEHSRCEWTEVAMTTLCDYEIGFNQALQLKWREAAACFERLGKEPHDSPASSLFFAGACHNMRDQHSDAILAFARVSELIQQYQSQGRTVMGMDAFVFNKVKSYQQKGYQDMELCRPALELLFVWNAFEHMDPRDVETCLSAVNVSLDAIRERERTEYAIRLKTLAPKTSPPDYTDRRATLLLIKVSMLNTLGRFRDGITDLNKIFDNKDSPKLEPWILPFTYWEAGVTSWGLGQHAKSRQLWQRAMSCNKYDLEYRLSIRLCLALNRCDEMGISIPPKKTSIRGPTTNGRKRMFTVQTKS